MILKESNLIESLLNEEMFGYFTGTSYYSTSINFFLYKNPTEKEWDDIPTYARGYISPQGDLYMQGTTVDKEEEGIIHVDLLKALKNQGLTQLPDDYIHFYFYSANSYMLYDLLHYGLLVQRKAKTRIIMFSESMHEVDANEYTLQSGRDVTRDAQALYNKVQSYCPYLQFEYWNNDEGEYEYSKNKNSNFKGWD